MNQQLCVAVALPINENGQILIAKRKDPETPETDGKWILIGGRVDFGEHPDEALVREVREESGLEVEVVRLLPKIFTNMFKMKNGDEVQAILLSYECKVVGGELHTSKFDEKISELKFVDINDIENYDTLPKTKETIALLKQ